MISFMSECKRVLKDTGTIWINLADSYMNNSSYCAFGRQGFNDNIIGTMYKSDDKIKQKSLMLIPQRFAIRCVDELGLILRNDIIWASTNKMPESVRDRFSKKHEYIFFFVKKQKYYFDLDSIRDKHKEVSLERYKRGVSENNKYWDSGLNIIGGPQNLSRPRQNTTKISKDSCEMFGSPRARIHRKNDNTNYGTDGGGIKNHKGNSLNHRKGKNPGDVSPFWDKKPYAIIDAQYRKDIIYYRELPVHDELREYLQEKRKIKNITIEEIENLFGGYKAHHWFEKDGSYPDAEDYKKLKEILELDSKYDKQMLVVKTKNGLKQNNSKGSNPGDVSDFWSIPTQPSSEKHYATFNTKLIDKPIIAGCPEGGIILDPFCGTGTTLLRGLQLNRKVIGIDGSKEYVAISRKRIKQELNQLKLGI